MRTFPPAPYKPTETFDVEASGRAYRIFVAPAMTPAGLRGRPLLVVLDGNVYTQPLSIACRLRGFVNREIDEPHVVGIGYPSDDLEDWLTRRNLDLTPTAPTRPQHPEDDISPHLWGGNDALLDLIEGTVVPTVAERWGVDRERTALYGHSYGGLATLHALFTRPQAFTSWLSISPSIWWEDGAVLEREADAFLRRPADGRKRRLLLAVGEEEARPPKVLPSWHYATPEWLAEHKRYTRMVDRLMSLADKLVRATPDERLVVKTRVMPGETHASAPFASLTPALDLAFPPPA